MVDHASVLMPYLSSNPELLEILKSKSPGINIKGEMTYKEEPNAINNTDFKMKSEFKTSAAL